MKLILLKAVKPGLGALFSAPKSLNRQLPCMCIGYHIIAKHHKKTKLIHMISHPVLHEVLPITYHPLIIT